MIHEVDDFIGDLISAVDRRGEDTIVVMFGDHLPTMGLSDSDMKSGDIFKTKYITWNNMGLPKEDADLTAYQLLSQITLVSMKEPCLTIIRHSAIPRHT